MKLIKTQKLTKVIEEYEISSLFPNVKLVLIKENGKTKDIKRIGTMYHDSNIEFVNDKFWELIKDYNPFINREKFMGCYLKIDEILSKEFEVTEKNTIFSYSAGHILFDIYGKPIPTIQYYDYIGTPFENSISHLEPMLKHLKTHPWILEPDSLKIVDVPYYNNEDGNRKYISGVKILPDKKSYEQVYKYSVEIDKKYFSCRMRERLVSMFYNNPSAEDIDYLGILLFRKKEK